MELETDTLYLDLQVKYSLPNKNAAEFLISKSIAEAYEADDPVVLYENNSAIVYYKDENGELQGYKKIFSAKKKKEILKKIEENGIKMFLNIQKERIWKSLKENKPYLHAQYSYTEKGIDYYDIFYDKKFLRPIIKAKGAVKTSAKKKKRLFLDYKNFKFTKYEIIFFERKEYKTIKNFKYFTKELSHELFKLINKKIYIEVITFNFQKNTLFLRLPYKNKKETISYITNRYKEIFNVNTSFLK